MVAGYLSGKNCIETGLAKLKSNEKISYFQLEHHFYSKT